jgi:TolB-like protein
MLIALLVGVRAPAVSARGRVRSVAVFPVENLSGGAIPGAEIRQAFNDRLTAAGVSVLDDSALETFMTSHRVRYAAGIDGATGTLLKKDTGVEAVLIVSAEFWSEAAPPKIAVFARLVSLVETPAVVWAADVGLSGDDEPGLFELGLVTDHGELFSRALDRMGDSLAAYVTTGRPGAAPKPASRFRPKSFLRHLSLEPDRTYSVAVVPFFNLSTRRNAGDIMALHFLRHLAATPPFRVVETGVTRGELLNARIIMDGGLSISDADLVASLVQADLVLAGRVIRYDDYEGPDGRNGVEFSAVLIDKQTRRVVWSSDSYNEGQEGLSLFGRGAIRTAHAMATQMVGSTTALMAGRRE